MDEQHRAVRRILLEARAQLETLEAAAANASLHPAASVDLRAAFQANLAALGAGAAGMRSALAATPPERRADWRARVAALEDEAGELAAADARLGALLRGRADDAGVREELLRRRGGGDAVIGIGVGPAPGVDGVLDEGRRLEGSGNGVSQMLATGTGALEALVSQRVRLKGARRKVMDVMNTMDAGRRLIAQIERRDRRDTLLMYACMAGILLLLGIAVLFKHHRRAA